MQIDFITIDFWNTVCKSNPDYKTLRNAEVKAYLEQLGYANVVDNLDAVYEECKKLFNEIEMATGRSFDVDHKQKLFFNKLGVPTEFVNDKYNEILQRCFVKHPPLVINKDVFDIMQKLSKNHYVVLLSNTGMIQSSLIINYISDHIPSQLDDYIFSDKSMYCKPNKRFFTEATSSIEGFRKTEWLHIGDDLQRDIIPTRELGGKAYHFKESADWERISSLLL